MPEIIEVYRFASYISQFVGCKLNNIQILGGRYQKHGSFGEEILFSKVLMSVQTKGKMMYMKFSESSTSSSVYLVVTLGLSGGWYGQTADNRRIHPLLNSSYTSTNTYFEKVKPNIFFDFQTTSGLGLYFYDTLSYGTMTILDESKMNIKLKSIGTDIIGCTEEEFVTTYKKKKNMAKEIAVVMMDQKNISGIGNYLKSDILYLSSISPFRLTKDLSDYEIKRIYQNAKGYVLTELGLLRNGFKLPQEYGREFFIYHQKTDINGYLVKSKKQKDRTTFYVEEIQV